MHTSRRRSRTIIALSSLPLPLLLLLASPPADAHNEVSLRISNSYLADDSFAAISEDNLLLQAELSYARALFDAQRGIWIETSWTVGAKRADLFGTALEARGLIQSLTIGGRYTWPLRPWLVPQARAGLGVIFGALSLDGDIKPGAINGEISDVSAGITAYLLAGVQLLLPRRWMYGAERGITGGVVIEGGVTVSSPLSFSLSPEPDEDLRTIPLSGTDVGSMSITGGVLRVGALLRF